MKLVLSFIFVLNLLFVFSSCSAKTKEVYNKPALYWYDEILKSLRFGDLEKADDFYISLVSEHFRSPILKETMLILFNAHLKEEEFLLSSFYLDEYIKRFGTLENIEFIEFLKIKAGYMSISTASKNQKLLLDTITRTGIFLNRYPNSKYLHEAKNMFSSLSLAKMYQNDKNANLYRKLGKEKAYEYYKNQTKEQWLKSISYAKPEIPWYKQLFE